MGSSLDDLSDFMIFIFCKKEDVHVSWIFVEICFPKIYLFHPSIWRCVFCPQKKPRNPQSEAAKLKVTWTKIAAGGHSDGRPDLLMLLLLFFCGYPKIRTKGSKCPPVDLPAPVSTPVAEPWPVFDTSVCDPLVECW